MATHYNSFVHGTSQNTNLPILVLGMAPFGLKHCCNPSRHTFNQFLTVFYLYILLFLLNSVPKFCDSLGRMNLPCKLHFEILLKMFNRV